MSTKVNDGAQVPKLDVSEGEPLTPSAPNAGAQPMADIGVPPIKSHLGSTLAQALAAIQTSELRREQMHGRLKGVFLDTQEAQIRWTQALTVSATLRDVELRQLEMGKDIVAGALGSASGVAKQLTLPRGAAQAPAAEGAGGAAEAHEACARDRVGARATDDAAAEPQAAEHGAGAQEGEHAGRAAGDARESLLDRLAKFENDAAAWTLDPAVSSEHENIESMRARVQFVQQGEASAAEAVKRMFSSEANNQNNRDALIELGQQAAHKTGNYRSE